MPALPSTDVPDVITVGRVSVDLYAQEVHASFPTPDRKSIGGSPPTWPSCSPRSPRSGCRKVGTDALGDYVIAL